MKTQQFKKRSWETVPGQFDGWLSAIAIVVIVLGSAVLVQINDLAL